MKRRGKRPITPCLIALYEEGMAAHGRGLTETDNPYEGTKRPKRSPEIAISCTFATCLTGLNTRFRAGCLHNFNISGLVTARATGETTGS